MDPYRSPPEETAHVEPQLDRLPVWVRFAPLRAGWIVVTPTALRFEPRAGRARTVPIAAGVEALRLSLALGADVKFRRGAISTAETVESWSRIVASAPYQQPLRAAPHRGILARAYGHSFAGGVHEDRSFVPIIDGDHLVVIEAAPSYDACFDRPPPNRWPDRSGRLLGRALAWLARDELAHALARVRATSRAGACRVFTRDEVGARPSYSVDTRKFELLGSNARDAIALEPNQSELAMLDRWVAGDQVR